MRVNNFRWLSLLAAPFLLAQTGCSDPSAGTYGKNYEAEIRWTSNGVPHITAANVPSAAYGQGYAFAQLNGCILADQVVKLRGERARFFGPGEEDANVDSDFIHKSLEFMTKGQTSWDAQTEETQAIVTGYAAGYNTFITERGDELPCGGEAWLQPITEQELMAHYVEISTLAGARALHEFIARAQPPGSELQTDPDAKLPDFANPDIGSNGWGIGKDRSAGGGGMLFANPHFPWEGELKLYESQMTVPGELNVYGASLMGVVGVLIGFNDAVAWTHTVSAGQRFTMYRLHLVPGDPTSYMYDGVPTAMESTDYSVDVLEPDGRIVPRTRKMWRTQWGPMLNIPVLNGWNEETALTFRDANELNTTLIQQFLDMNKADSMDAFQQAHADNQGIPWVNTMSASADGRAWYADSTPTPNLTPSTIENWRNTDDVLVTLVKTIGAVALQGNTSADEWQVVDGARDPGLVPFAAVPQLERSDFIYNANDSHWLTNPAQPLVGYSPMHGEEGTPRRPRTRMNATLLTETGPESASGADNKFDLAELQAAVLSNRGLPAELLRDAVVARCEASPSVTLSVDDADRTIDLMPACKALANWDLRIDLDSPGAVMWREFLGDFTFEVLKDSSILWETRFDAANPIATPNGLAPADDGDDGVLEALGNAILRLERAGLNPNSSLREAQFTKKGAQQIPIHGGGRFEGTTNLITYSVLKSTLEPNMPRGEVINGNTALTDEGYVINYGTSFIMALEFTDEGPDARAFLTYSQSGNPDSKWYADQTQRFSDKNWRQILYTEDAILADPELEVEAVAGNVVAASSDSETE